MGTILPTKSLFICRNRTLKFKLSNFSDSLSPTTHHKCFLKLHEFFASNGLGQYRACSCRPSAYRYGIVRLNVRFSWWDGCGFCLFTAFMTAVTRQDSNHNPLPILFSLVNLDKDGRRQEHSQHLRTLWARVWEVHAWAISHKGKSINSTAWILRRTTIKSHSESNLG